MPKEGFSFIDNILYTSRRIVEATRSLKQILGSYWIMTEFITFLVQAWFSTVYRRCSKCLSWNVLHSWHHRTPSNIVRTFENLVKKRHIFIQPFLSCVNWDGVHDSLNMFPNKEIKKSTNFKSDGHTGHAAGRGRVIPNKEHLRTTSFSEHLYSLLFL